ncbi:SIMPL domain-containing protein [Kiloniella sp. b19]|uniref:SIMPL domain-containing protein n=1 Tax=Kiloniella sp. GXU_MW_B19 TaxID=3141326 RepID=UPI0031E101B2
MGQNSGNTGLVAIAVALVAGLALGGFFVSQTLYNAKVAVNTAEAKGLAERRVKADQVSWTVRYRLATAERSGIPALYEEAEKQKQDIAALLMDKGFSQEDLTYGVIDYYPQIYRNSNQQIVDESHELSGSITVSSDKVDLVRKVRGDVNSLIAKGYDIVNEQPAFRFTSLNDIKPDMLREATQNARIAANEFASNAGVEVGSIRSARQGSFYVRDAGEEYGDTQKIEKDVRVVTTITFYLTE